MTAVRRKADPPRTRKTPRDAASSPPAEPSGADKPIVADKPSFGTNALDSSTFLALLTLLALVALPYLHPALQRFRLLTPLPEGQGLVAVAPAAAPTPSVGETPLAVETTPQSELSQPEEVSLPPAAAEIIEPVGTAQADKPPRSIDDPSGHALDAFFERLRAVERKEPGSIARITYFGDSIVASDFITATLRRKLQKRFGDAGHGYMLMANAWPGYFHNDVERFAAPGWKVSRVVGPYAPDGFYGLGGVSFKAVGKGAFSRFSTAKEGSFGRNVSRFVVHWLAHPEGGPMTISIDGEARETIDTKAATATAKFSTYPVPDGPHGLEVRAEGAGVRAFGVVMERDTPGVVLDAIGIQGCRIRFLDKSDDAHFAEQLQARNSSLTVFQYGMNESEDGELFPLDQYESTMRDVLKQVRTAQPNSSCLLIGPMDRADKKANGYTSRPVVPKLAAIQKRVAGEVGCAYWDTLSAMGGLGSMGIWVQRGLGGADLAHPSSTGADVLGRWIYLALMEGYANYVGRGQH
jgi:lysophospholipase L1-like esterase